MKALFRTQAIDKPNLARVIDGCSQFLRVPQDQLKQLGQIFSTQTKQDRFALSSAYYGLTGRNGLDKNFLILIKQHNYWELIHVIAQI